MKINSIKIYYLALGAIVAAHLFYTLCCGGSLLYTRTQVASLKQELSVLKDRKLEIAADSSDRVALSELLESDQVNEFIPISKPKIIHVDTVVALNQ